ncbi:MAG: glycosyltransferase family 39 protein [Kiritimatiellae bacterium]|nr:glycosyltransferase family 39 protein [Kiritimatiellia bacterium]
MHKVAAFLFHKRTSAARWFFGGLLLLLLIVTRWLWIDCDGGTPSLTEYGYFATDEGFYACGGKQKFLLGRFISLIRANPNTFAICPASHLLTWLAFSLFGQNTWAHRFFPLLLNTGAWLAAYAYLSKKTLAWIAFLLCACVALNPLLLVYGRTVCNDTLMASLLLIGYVVTRRQARWAPFAGGCLFGLGVWIKPSIWLLALFGLSGAAISPCVRRRWPRIGLFALGFGLSCCLGFALIRLLIHPEAVLQNVTVDELLAASDSSYPLPNPFDWSATFRGVSSFPRFPSGGLLSMWIPLFLILPALLLLRRLTERPLRWDGRLLLYLVPPLYAGGIMIMPVYYAHYFIPVIAFLPVIWLEARHDLKRWAGHDHLFSLALWVMAALFVFASFHSFDVSEAQAESLNDYLANAYNLPQRIVWTRNGGYILTGAALLTAMGLWGRRRPLTVLTAGAILASALLVSGLCYSRLPLSEAYKYTALFPSTIKDVAFVLQIGSLALFFAVWCLPGLLRTGCRWHLLLAALLTFATLANPRWRRGTRELARRGTLHRQAVAELAKLLPEDAVVFGERAPQLCLPLKARTAPAPNTDPVPMALAIRERYPQFPQFALLDAEHNYHFTHYENNKHLLELKVLHTLVLPSFNNGLPVQVFLTRLLFKEPSGAGPRLNATP